MLAREIEHWAREIIERVLRGGQAEDVRVEVKAQWPTDHRDIARRIGAICNAARLQSALLLIGLDEGNHALTNPPGVELATWCSQVASHFESSAPTHTEHVFNYDDNNSVTAVQFDTDAAPYVVRTGIGKFTLEVPWREGTQTQSARRGDLLKILIPATTRPQVTLVSCDARPDHQGRMQFQSQLLLAPAPGASPAILLDRCSLVFPKQLGGEFATFQSLFRWSGERIGDTPNPAVLDRPRYADFTIYDGLHNLQLREGQISVPCTISLGLAFDEPILIPLRLKPTHDKGNVVWVATSEQ